jgi:hypothetical protein
MILERVDTNNISRPFSLQGFSIEVTPALSSENTKMSILKLRRPH